MNDKEQLLEFINNPKEPNVYEWVNEISEFLDKTELGNPDLWQLTDQIEKWGDNFDYCEKLVAKLKILYKKNYENVVLPTKKIKKQIFVAMWFSKDMEKIYTNVYKTIAKNLNYEILRIDEKEFSGSIIDQISMEISDSSILIADLTGNRGAVYYEAGIAKGLQMCNHPIKLVLTCESNYFNGTGVHFDVKGDNIIIYNDEEDLKNKLDKRLNCILKEA